MLYKRAFFGLKGAVLFGIGLWVSGACNAPSRETERSHEDLVIIPGERVGVVSSTSTEESLRKQLGAARVQVQEMGVGDSESSHGLLIYPGSDRELEVAISEPTGQATPLFVRISKPNSVWKTSQGVGIGTTLAQLEKLNNGPLDFYGFDWDYGGLVVDLKQGDLDKSIMLALMPLDYDDAGADLLGDRKIASDTLGDRKNKIVVASMLIPLNTIGQQ